MAVPVRDLFEALGAQVRWDDKDRAVHLTVRIEPPPVPQRVAETVLPLRLAFIHEKQLWLLEGGRPGAAPQLVPGGNVDQIVGWSRDGQWLAYLQRQGDNRFPDDLRLWVVRADGQQAQCLDDAPVAPGAPAWSPIENAIAYQTFRRVDQETLGQSLKLARLEKGKWENRELLSSADKLFGSGLAWFPDGQSMAISWQRHQQDLPAVDRIDLQGQTSPLFILPASDAENGEDDMFTREIRGLKLSPDGRYLAYFLGMNSGSLNADCMTLQVVDLQNPQTPFTVGGALGYPQWLAWSPDSRQLACILGCDRTASYGKHLTIVKMENTRFQVKDLGKPGMVDARPF